MIDRLMNWRGGTGYLLACGATLPLSLLALWLFGSMWQ
jgi:hypothetical protein